MNRNYDEIQDRIAKLIQKETDLKEELMDIEVLLTEYRKVKPYSDLPIHPANDSTNNTC